MTQLPPLNSLKAFEAAARHGGYIAASEELHVTRGAISRHVKQLETHLGVQLFERRAQGVRLTNSGRELLTVLTEAFGMISAETQRLSINASELRVICPPGTSIRWLLPKLEGFRTAHPDIDVKLTTDFHSDKGFNPPETDIGFSVTNWPNSARDLEVLTIFPTLLTPACTPDYIDKHALHSPSQLASCNLLHEAKHPLDWREWINQYAPDSMDARSGQDFPNIDMAVKAAVMGLGVVMANLILCREELENGTLVAPFPDMICEASDGGICLLGTSSAWTTPKVEAFRSWVYEVSEKDREYARQFL